MDLLCTEGFCNLSSKRGKAFELFFEGYGMNRVLPLSEPLVSMYEYQESAPLTRLGPDYGMLVSVGNRNCMITPIIEGNADFYSSRRINVGLHDSFNVMSKMFTLKYEYLCTKMDFATLKTIFDKFSFCATDYEAQLRYFQKGKAAFKSLGYSHPLTSSYQKEMLENLSGRLRAPTFLEFYETELEKRLYEEDQIKKKKMRQEQAARIREAMAVQREERKNNQKAELAKLESLLVLKETDNDTFQNELQLLDIEGGVKEVEKMVKKLKIKLGVISKSELENDRYSYIKIPDSELTPQQLRVKRMQVMHQQAAEVRQAKKEEKAKKKEELARMKSTNPEHYIKMLQDKRKNLKDKIRTKKSMREDFNARKSKNQRMMKILDNYLEKDGDESEWLQKELNTVNSDVENYEAKLIDVETELRDVDPTFEDESVVYANMFKNGSIIEFAGDAIRPLETLFQPYLVGNDQTGLSDTIIFVANKFPSDVRQKLFNNIYLRGGGASLDGICERLKYDIERNSECSLNVQIHKNADPVRSGWKNMHKMLSERKSEMESYWITKAEYEEMGDYCSIPRKFAYSNR